MSWHFCTLLKHGLHTWSVSLCLLVKDLNNVLTHLVPLPSCVILIVGNPSTTLSGFRLISKPLSDTHNPYYTDKTHTIHIIQTRHTIHIIQTDRQTERQTERQTDIQRHTYRHTNTDRQTNTDRHDRQIDRVYVSTKTRYQNITSNTLLFSMVY